jgi:hypothetical protein
MRLISCHLQRTVDTIISTRATPKLIPRIRSVAVITAVSRETAAPFVLAMSGLLPQSVLVTSIASEEG